MLRAQMGSAIAGLSVLRCACVHAQGCTRLRSLTLRHAGEEARALAAAPTQLVALLAQRCKLLAHLTLDSCDLGLREFEVCVVECRPAAIAPVTLTGARGCTYIFLWALLLHGSGTGSLCAAE